MMEFAVLVIVLVTVGCLSGFAVMLQGLDYSRLTRARAFHLLGTGGMIRPPR